LIILIIDLKLRKKLYNKIEFNGADVVRMFILGVLGTVFLSIGIFILLKSILLLLLFVGKPIDLNGKLKIKEPETNIVPVQKELPKEPKVEQIKKEEIPEERLDSIPSEPKPQIISAEEKIPEEETEEVKIIEEEPEKEIAKDIIPKKKVEDIKLRKKLYNKIEFNGADVVRMFILGVLGTVFLSIGIFILLKSILLLLLFVGKPIDLNGKLKIKEPETNIVPVQKELPKEPKVEQIKKEEIPEERLDSIPSEPKPQIISAEEKIPEEETEEVKIIEEEPEKEIAK
ncbi:unnamed protein product, partial [marine sediment metagenome]